jgi:hypothetical protein
MFSTPFLPVNTGSFHSHQPLPEATELMLSDAELDDFLIWAQENGVLLQMFLTSLV